jgi:hydrogenase-4 component E
VDNAVNSLLVVALVCGFVCLGFRRASHCVYAVAVQGVITGLLLLLVHGEPDRALIAVAASSIVVKGIAVPWLLIRSTRSKRAEATVEPLFGFNLSMILGGIAFGVCLWLSKLLILPYQPGPALVVPVSLATVLIGLVALVSRRAATTQVAAFLVLENGIFMFGLVIASALPALIEMGVLLDLFASVFVMGVTIYHINREFDHVDTSKLNMLHDLVPRRRWRLKSRPLPVTTARRPGYLP